MQPIVLFQEQNIRRTWHEGEWWFSVVDIVSSLTESIDGRKYWNKLKQRLNEENVEVVTFCHQLKLPSPDGKMRLTDCANIKILLRIIQSIPSSKAEPFKQWLAQVGAERIQEIENPELAQERMKGLYEAKGYPKEWIEKRLRGIAVRQDLTDEWKARGIESQKDYAILTAEISATEKPQDILASRKVATRGGGVAGVARKQTQEELGRSIISNENYLHINKILTNKNDKNL